MAARPKGVREGTPPTPLPWRMEGEGKCAQLFCQLENSGEFQLAQSPCFDPEEGRLGKFISLES